MYPSISPSNLYNFFKLYCVIRKDQKKVDKLTAQIPYHEGRMNKEEVEKIKDQIAHIWEKAKEAQFA
jgi:hypothetical protein